MADLWKDVLPNVVIPVLVVIISPIISLIVANEGNKRKLGKEWKCKYRKSSATYCVNLIIFCMLFVLIAPFLGGVLLGLCLPNVKADILVKVGGLSLYVIFIIITNVLIFKTRLFVLKRDSKLFKGIFVNLLLAGGLGVFSFLFLVPSLRDYIGILCLIIVLLEVMAFFIFEDKQYFQYSKAKIILDDNKVITGVDSSSIYVKGKWFIASYVERGKEKEIRVLQDKVQKIIYYEKQF